MLNTVRPLQQHTQHASCTLQDVNLEFAVDVTDQDLQKLRGYKLESLNLNACQRSATHCSITCLWNALEFVTIAGMVAAVTFQALAVHIQLHNLCVCECGISATLNASYAS